MYTLNELTVIDGRRYWTALVCEVTFKSSIFFLRFFPSEVNFIRNFENDEQSMFSRTTRWAFAISSRQLFIQIKLVMFARFCSLLSLCLISLFKCGYAIQYAFGVLFVFLFRTTRISDVHIKYASNGISIEFNLYLSLLHCAYIEKSATHRFIHTYWLKAVYTYSVRT